MEGILFTILLWAIAGILVSILIMAVCDMGDMGDGHGFGDGYSRVLFFGSIVVLGIASLGLLLIKLIS
jgi:hypothetical protein